MKDFMQNDSLGKSTEVPDTFQQVKGRMQYVPAVDYPVDAALHSMQHFTACNVRRQYLTATDFNQNRTRP